MRGFALPASFWRKFGARYGTNHPHVMRRPFATPLASAPEVFAALVRCRERLARKDTPNLKFFVGDGEIRSPIDALVPMATDRDMDAYSERLGLREFGVMALGFQQELGWTIWNRIREFLENLYRVRGLPALHAELDLFAGNYPITPFGIHRDTADVFCFVVEGKKRMRFWPHEKFASRSPKFALRDYREHLADSISVEGEPGDIIYWPSSYWHVGESDGGVCSSLSLALYYPDSPAALVTKAVAAALAKTPMVAAYPLGKLPPEVAKVARAELDLDLAVMQQWLEKRTAYSFTVTPPLEKRTKLGLEDTISGTPSIEAARVGKTLVVAVNGRSFCLPHSAELARIVALLQKRKPFRLDTIRSAAARERALRVVNLVAALHGAADARDRVRE